MTAYNVISPAAMVTGQPEDVSVILANLNAIANVLNGNIDDANVKAAAAIAYSKLNLALGIVNADIAVAAAIAPSKIAVAPRAKATKSANQSLTSSTTTIITWDTEVVDTDTMHDLVTNNDRLTCKTAGIYLIRASVSFAPNATGYRAVAIGLNGNYYEVQKIPAIVDATHTSTVQVVAIILLAVNDYVNVSVLQTSGGPLNVLATDPGFSTVSSLEAIRIAS